MLVLLLPVVWFGAELLLIIWIAGQVGALATIGLLLLAAMAGLMLIRGQQLAVLAQMTANKAQPMDMPREGGFRLFAGILFLVPGFLSDVLALIFLIRPLRLVFGTLLMKRFSPLAEQVRVYRYRGGNIYEHEEKTYTQNNDSDDAASRIIEGERAKSEKNKAL